MKKNHTFKKTKLNFKISKTVALLILTIYLFLTYSSIVMADDIKDAKKATSAFFKNQSFIAKIDLQTTSEYHVTPDGRPSENKIQGRSKKRLGIGQRDVAFATGSGGKGIYVSVKKRKKQIIVSLTPKRGPTMHQSRLFINFDRPVEATDVTPEVIARALSSYVEFTGVEVGGELNSAIKQLTENTTTQENSTQPLARFDNVLVTVNPSIVNLGENASLNLSFDIISQSPQLVNETRTLKFNGQLLPGFPKEHSQMRDPGNHVSRYNQPIPTSANTGKYSYKGEVCVEGECTSRIVVFSVE